MRKPIKDGAAPNRAAQKSLPEVVIKVGSYRFVISADQFTRWEDAIRADAGFSRKEIIAAIKARLQL